MKTSFAAVILVRMNSSLTEMPKHLMSECVEKWDPVDLDGK